MKDEYFMGGVLRSISSTTQIRRDTHSKDIQLCFCHHPFITRHIPVPCALGQFLLGISSGNETQQETLEGTVS
jgi:hypothetical protein